MNKFCEKSAPENIVNLVQQFERDYEQIKTYNEESVRQYYLNQFFEILDWDVSNKKGVQEVIPEDRIKIEGKTKAPDYGFYINNHRKFFLEAKKPSIKLHKGSEADRSALQLRRYGWSASLHISILTNFKELAIYNCRVKPQQDDSASKARIKYFTFEQYIDKWQEISDLLSRESVATGALEKYVEQDEGKKFLKSEIIPVDDDFLQVIQKWRENLAQSLIARNQLSVYELNFAVQTTINRIVFLRICEDLGIEPYGNLKKVVDKENYDGLFRLFRQADNRYNSGLFHFFEDKTRTTKPDELAQNLAFSNYDLKTIVNDIYTAYEFSVIPVEVLGHIYEQFLGKIIVLNKKNNISVEDKPEVRKAGGVYYTPDYIVNYIVENTVGKLLAGKTPKQAEKLKILDPACGSGSFLLGAYHYLLNWHLTYYVENNPKRRKNVIFQINNTWQLTTHEKKRILLNNIYGVDIDEQAVEIAKFSLLLKVLEGESEESFTKNEMQLKLIKERILPDLDNNIKCGNSLISSDFYDNEQNDFLDEDLRRRVNTFDWDSEFKDIIKAGGFDAVIGNPPYVGEKGNKETFRRIKQSFMRLFYQRKMDLFYFFIHLALNLSKKYSRIGFISTNYYLTATSGEKLRKDLNKRATICNLINLNELKIFESARGQHNMITILNKGHDENIVAKNCVTQRSGFANQDVFENIISGYDKKTKYYEAFQGNLYEGDDFQIRLVGNDRLQLILEKIKKQSTLLGNLCHVNQGILSGIDKITPKHIKNFPHLALKENQGVYVVSRSEYEDFEQCNDILKPWFKNSDIYKYYTNNDSNTYLIYATRNLEIEKYPLIYNHLLKYEEVIKARSQDRGEMQAALKLGKWWVIFAARKNINFESQKIVVPQRSYGNTFGYNEVAWYASADVYYITQQCTDIALKYILVLLNSKIYYIWLYYKGKRKGEMLELYQKPLFQIPIKKLQIEQQKPFVKKADQILALHKQLNKAKINRDKELIQRQIDKTDKEIDQLVYELYELTPEEIQIVENAT